MIVLHALWAGVAQSLGFFWDSLFGLILGFLVSAIVQVTLTPSTMERYLGSNLRGIVLGALFGIISSACSYGAAAAARGFYRKGADIRSIFSFLIASTNMNVAIVILFWSLLGWRFAFAEFFGGIIIIAVVVAGLSIMLKSHEFIAGNHAQFSDPASDQSCHTGPFDSAQDKLRVADTESRCRDTSEHCHISIAGNPGTRSLTRATTWYEIGQTAIADVRMLQNELLIGYLVAGFAAALVPQEWLANALHYVGTIPFIGYVLLLLAGLLLAVVTFVCSMGNVPVARFLAMAGIPLGANTTFIYGDLLILPLVGIYRKSFPPKIVWAFLLLFIIGAMAAGALMDFVLGGHFGTTAIGSTTMGSMAINDRFTLVANIVALIALVVVTTTAAVAKRRIPAP